MQLLALSFKDVEFKPRFYTVQIINSIDLNVRLISMVLLALRYNQYFRPVLHQFHQ